MRKAAKQKRGQPIENKQSREIAPFALPMISMTYDPRRETFPFAYAQYSFRFRGLRPGRGPKRSGRFAALPRGAANVKT
jgi:hypothetical protein